MDTMQLMQRLETITHKGGGRWYLDEAEGERRIVVYTAGGCFCINDNCGCELLDAQLQMIENTLQ